MLGVFKEIKKGGKRKAKTPQESECFQKMKSYCNEMNLEFKVRNTFAKYVDFLHQGQLVVGSRVKMKGVLWKCTPKARHFGVWDLTDEYEIDTFIPADKHIWFSSLNKWNQAVATLCGANPKTTKNFAKFDSELRVNTHFDLKPAYRDWLLCSISAPQECQAKYRMKNKDGSERHVFIPPKAFALFDFTDIVGPVIATNFVPPTSTTIKQNQTTLFEPSVAQNSSNEAPPLKKIKPLLQQKRKHMSTKDRDESWTAFYGSVREASCIVCNHRQVYINSYGHDSAHIIEWRCLTLAQDHHIWMHIPTCRSCNGVDVMPNNQNGLYSIFKAYGIEPVHRVLLALKRYYDKKVRTSMGIQNTDGLLLWSFKMYHMPFESKNLGIPVLAFWHALVNVMNTHRQDANAKATENMQEKITRFIRNEQKALEANQTKRESEFERELCDFINVTRHYTNA